MRRDGFGQILRTGLRRVTRRTVGQVGPALAFAAAMTTLSAAALSAEPYRLVAGDRIALTFSAQGTTEEMTVDIDGQVRLRDLGGVDVEGLTLDAAEDLLSGRIEEAGIYLNPQISMMILEYSPVMVAGDVTRPGRFEFSPGMTVAAALALSGGTQASGVSRFEIDRARTENEGLIRSLNLQIAATVVRMARLEAALAGAESYDLPERLVSRIPSVAAVSLEALNDAEQKLFDAERQREAANMASWAEEIEQIETQQSLFQERIEVAEAIIASTGRELDSARQLQERGLSTAGRLATVEQRDADARARVLELESARIAATRALSDARRARAQFLANREEQRLSQLQDLRVDLDDLLLGYARRLDQQAILTGGSMGTLMTTDAVEVRYEVASPREERDLPEVIAPTTRLLPGDTLIVSIDAAPMVASGQ